MYKMSEHQRRLWMSMIDKIQSYVEGKNNDFHGLVGELEGALDAGEFRNEELIKGWYDVWTPLEIRRSIEGNNVKRIEAIQELETMKKYLIIKGVDNHSSLS
jgi:hypothetical protein